MAQITASEMARRSHRNRTREDRERAALKGKNTLLKKYGKNFYARIRKGEAVDILKKDENSP